MLTVHSQSISETAQDEIENMPDMAPGNPLHIDLPVRISQNFSQNSWAWKVDCWDGKN